MLTLPSSPRSPNPAPLEQAKLLELLTNAYNGTRPQ